MEELCVDAEGGTVACSLLNRRCSEQPPANYRQPPADRTLLQLADALEANTDGLADEFVDSASQTMERKISQLVEKQQQLYLDAIREAYRFGNWRKFGAAQFPRTDPYDFAKDQSSSYLDAMKTLFSISGTVDAVLRELESPRARGALTTKARQELQQLEQTQIDAAVKDFQAGQVEEALARLFPRLANASGERLLPRTESVEEFVEQVRLPALIKALREFDRVIQGRPEVKNWLVRKLEAFIANPKTANRSQNIILTGPAGSGKTTVAEQIGKVLKQAGFLLTDKFNKTTRSDFVAQFEGQTAPKTRATLDRAYEGVLFLDEAYSLTRREGARGEFDSYGQESIAEMLPWLTDNEGNIVFIAAGYYNLMCSQFLQSNEGVARRFPTRIDLRAFSPTELYRIFDSTLKRVDPNATVSDDAVELFLDIAAKYGDTVFNNQASDADAIGKRLAEYGGENKTLCDMLQVLINFTWEEKRAVICEARAAQCGLGAEDSSRCLRPAEVSPGQLESEFQQVRQRQTAAKAKSENRTSQRAKTKRAR